MYILAARNLYVYLQLGRTRQRQCCTTSVR